MNSKVIGSKELPHLRKVVEVLECGHEVVWDIDSSTYEAAVKFIGVVGTVRGCDQCGREGKGLPTPG